MEKYSFWKPKEGEEVTVRFIPDTNPVEPDFRPVEIKPIKCLLPIKCPLCELGYPLTRPDTVKTKELDEEGHFTGRYIHLKRSTYEKIKLAVEEALADPEINVEINNY